MLIDHMRTHLVVSARSSPTFDCLDRLVIYFLVSGVSRPDNRQNVQETVTTFSCPNSYVKSQRQVEEPSFSLNENGLRRAIGLLLSVVC